MSPEAEFDQHAGGYAATLDESLQFLGESSAYFAQIKVELMLEATHRLLGSPEQRACLDVGCGIGVAEQFLVTQYGRVVGVDVSEKMLEQARKAVPQTEFVHFNGGRLPFEDGGFDVTFCYCVFHHVPLTSLPDFVSEMKRVTRPGGLVFTFDHNPLNPVTRYIVDKCPFDRDAHLLSMGRAVDYFERGGLQVVERAYYLFFPRVLRCLRPLERYLRWLPLGAQYYVAGRVPHS